MSSRSGERRLLTEQWRSDDVVVKDEKNENDSSKNSSDSHFKKSRTVVINSARSTEYKKVKSRRKKAEGENVLQKPKAVQDISSAEINENSPKENSTGELDENKEGMPSSAKEGESTKEDSSAIEENKDLFEEYEEELVIFTGNVSISVSDGSSTSTIIADKVIYNKTRSTMEASGNVQFERKIGKQVAEKFSGEYLLFDIEKMQGVFYKGILQQESNKKGRDPFSMHTYIAGKDESGVIGFKNSFLTTSKDEDSLWSIRASRLWILPGSEMAFANGVLSIGVVPLFYLPFFYYPADEMIFHPVFGFKNREGYFLQTTTYLIGRKPLPKQEKGSSFSNFLQGDALKKQKLEGLFFKKLDENDSIQDPSYLKVIFDMYSRLGYLVGTEGKFSPKRGYIRGIDFSAFLGFSNTIYPIKNSGGNTSSKDNLFSSFAPGGEKKSELNKSNLFGKIVPFRYNFHFNMSLTREPFNVSIAFPFISDPYFKKDFMTRSEDMNWFNYLLNRDKLAKESSTTSEESSYMWKVQGSIRPSFPILRPYIASIYLDDISTALNFYSKTHSKLKDYDAIYSPERKFYYPQSAKPFVKASLAGSLFSTSIFEKTPKQKKGKEIPAFMKEMDNPFLEEEAKTTDSNKEKTEKKEEKLLSELSPEELDAKIGEITDGVYQDLLGDVIPIYKVPLDKNKTSYFLTNIFKYDLTYKLGWQYIYEAIFDHNEWKEPKDINWKKFFSKYYQFKTDTTFTSNLAIYKGLLSLTNSLLITSNYQKHPFVKDESKKDTLQLNNYKANIYTIRNDNVLKVSPFINFDMFKATNFSYSLSEILLKNKFVGTVAEPKWEKEKVKWKKEQIVLHSASALLSVKLKEYTQSFSVSMNLKPLLVSYAFGANFSIPYLKMSLSSKYFEKEKPEKGPLDKKEKKWFWEPLKFTTSLSLPFKISLSQEYVYNIEEKKHDKYALSFAWKSLSARYFMSRVIPYKLDKDKGWLADGKEKKFIPTSFTLSFSNSSSPFEFYFWKNRVHFSAFFNANLNLNLVRLTDSYFTFSPKLTFKIHEFIDISFSVTSRNDSIVKYFGNNSNLPVSFPGEKNIIKDIGYSLFFWDTEKRRSSDFKVKSIDFQLTHNLKDWTMSISYSIKPILKTEAGKKLYKFDPTISFFVQWNPIGDIKVRAKEEEKKFAIERGEIK